jgi:hypothetical protein
MKTFEAPPSSIVFKCKKSDISRDAYTVFNSELAHHHIYVQTFQSQNKNKYLKMTDEQLHLLFLLM